MNVQCVVFESFAYTSCQSFSSKDRNFSVSCGIHGCVEHFRSFSVYNSHVYRRHRTAIGLKDSTIGAFAGSEERVEEDLPEVDDHRQQSAPCEYRLYDQLPHQPDNAKFLMSLSEGRQLSQVAVSRRICKETVQTVLPLELSEKYLDISVSQCVLDALTKIPDPFEGIDTNYLRVFTKHMNDVVSALFP